MHNSHSHVYNLPGKQEFVIQCHQSGHWELQLLVQMDLEAISELLLTRLATVTVVCKPERFSLLLCAFEFTARTVVKWGVSEDELTCYNYWSTRISYGLPSFSNNEQVKVRLGEFCVLV